MIYTSFIKQILKSSHKPVKIVHCLILNIFKTYSIQNLKKKANKGKEKSKREKRGNVGLCLNP